jgi:hypothetical protein
MASTFNHSLLTSLQAKMEESIDRNMENSQVIESWKKALHPGITI